MKQIMQWILLMWIVSCGTANLSSSQELLLSKEGNSLQRLVDKAINSGSTAILDRSITVTNSIVVNGNLQLKGMSGVVITNKVMDNDGKLFVLGRGNHSFAGFTIQQHPNGNAFTTIQDAGSLWNNFFDGVHITNGRTAYQSSRGGNEKTWCITTWKNSSIRVATVAIGIFSQDGPFKALHLDNMDIANGKAFGNHIIDVRQNPDHITHTLYCHPNVSLDFKNVVLAAGGLALHHFSGGGVPGHAKYLRFDSLICKSGAFEMVTPGNNPIIIKNSELGPYTTLGVPNPMVDAINTKFKNSGNGISLRGKLTACTGSVWTSGYGSLEIINCQLDELNFRPGGRAIVRNSNIQFIGGGDRGNRFEGEFYNTQIGSINITEALGTLKMDRRSLYKQNNNNVPIIKMAN